MTTALTKPVSRQTYSTFSDKRGARPLIVTLLPGDVLEFREKGRRKRWVLPISVAAIMAVRAEVAREKKLRAEDRAAKKKTRRR